jgi:hypothetical protein
VKTQEQQQQQQQVEGLATLLLLLLSSSNLCSCLNLVLVGTHKGLIFAQMEQGSHYGYRKGLQRISTADTWE